MTRPRNPRTDSNHRIVPQALEELGLVEVDPSRKRYTTMIRGEYVVALDISSLPGQIDYIIFGEKGWVIPVEVKEKGKEEHLTAGELSWRETLGVLVASSSDTVKYKILEMLKK